MSFIHSWVHCNWASKPFLPWQSTLNKVTNDFLTFKCKGHFSVIVLVSILKYRTLWPFFPISNSPSSDPRTKASPDVSFLTWKLLVSDRLFPFLPALSTLCISRVTTEGLCISFHVSKLSKLRTICFIYYLHFNDCNLSVLESTIIPLIILNSLLSPFLTLTNCFFICHLLLHMFWVFFSSVSTNTSSLQVLIIPSWTVCTSLLLFSLLFLVVSLWPPILQQVLCSRQKPYHSPAQSLQCQPITEAVKSKFLMLIITLDLPCYHLSVVVFTSWMQKDQFF